MAFLQVYYYDNFFLKFTYHFSFQYLDKLCVVNGKIGKRFITVIIESGEKLCLKFSGTNPKRKLLSFSYNIDLCTSKF